MSSNDTLAQSVLSAVRSVLPDARPVPLHAPNLGEVERDAILQAVDSSWISSSGGSVDQFEAALADYTNARHVICTVNGTAAIHLALMSVGVSPGDEVITPALTFIATANAVSHCGAIPHFADCDSDTFGIDPVALRSHFEATVDRRATGCVNRITGRPITAILVAHILGRPALVQALRQLADDYALPLVEDAAEALGSRIDGVHAGLFGRLGTLSFNGNKIVTTGGGGAIITDDSELAEKVRHLGTTARMPHPYRFIHDIVAYNYRMPSLNAALGVAQLTRLDPYIEAKHRLYAMYQDVLQPIDGISLLPPPALGKGNEWLITAALDQPDMAVRDEILDALVADGIHARPVWDLLPSLPMYQSAPCAALPQAKRAEASLICLPSSPILGEDL